MLKNVDCFFTRAEKSGLLFSRVLKNVDCFFTRAEKREVLFRLLFGDEKIEILRDFRRFVVDEKIEILRFS